MKAKGGGKSTFQRNVDLMNFPDFGKTYTNQILDTCSFSNENVY